MQLVHHYSSSGWHELSLPPPDAPLQHMPQIKWGQPAHLFSPSFWRFQHWVEIELEPKQAPRCQLGEGGLLEEIIACLLGGHGLPAETSLAYFSRMKSTGFLHEKPKTPEVVEDFLKEPVQVGGSLRRYRFWRTKAKAIWAILTKHREDIERIESSLAEPRQTRDKLTKFPGIGLKTASWICRNWLNNDDLAVLDIHILRSLSKLGCSVASVQTPRHYFEAESHFLALSHSLGIPTRSLDLVMWAITRQLPTNML